VATAKFGRIETISQMPGRLDELRHEGTIKSFIETLLSESLM
jgi:hypothetical protein